ncbi:WD repeat-containing and planar cell polarity effector protein fritz homolog isoform X2 [Scleropages formosus]|uniref:WD repeat-containing and planar cell polarity effector protein fritz homolog isoform X2 n=1 Tax=Scleropages formosus TaxID=113540 RepID=UPI0010FA64AB|nr:WD repeat-containing and planar cell polarity effector protein fritz homolog isoform X2 [Scleropages formosus]
MAFCLAELHLWSCRSSLKVADTDIGTYQFYDKGEPGGPEEHHFYREKQQFAEARGYTWTPGNQRPEKLRDSLKELEELLQTSTCVHCRWRSKRSCQLLLNSGLLITLNLSGPQLDRVFVDRTLVGRLPGSSISDAVMTDRLLLLTFTEKNQVCLVHLSRHVQGSPELGPRFEKLSPSELKVCCVDLPGLPGRRLDRRVHLNSVQDMALCWWAAVDNEAWPWSPVSSQEDRANLVLLACGVGAGGGLKVLSCVRTEGDPLDCRFSLRQPYRVLTAELAEGGESVRSCAYECARGRPQRLSADRVPVAARPVSCSRDPGEGRLLLGLRDSSLLLADGGSGRRVGTRTPMLPSLLAWHPTGALLVAAGAQGELQCFDAGLTPMGLQLLTEDSAPPAGPTLQLSRHLRAAEGLAGLRWAAAASPPGAGADAPEVHDLLMLAFHGGPLAALRFRLGTLTGGQLGPAELVRQRLRYGQAGAAVELLGTMDWSIAGAECYGILATIMDHLFRVELDADAEAHMEAALGTFYAPRRPLSHTVVLEYRDPICKYARRFFHHLLRHQRFEKAFLLALDIGARDLFMDIHHAARDRGELVLAHVAKRKAKEIDAEPVAGGEEEPRLQGGKKYGVESAQPWSGSSEGSRLPGGSAKTVAPCSAFGGSLDQQQKGTRPEAVTADPTWPWRRAETDLVDGEGQAPGESGSLKVVHFGLV